MQGRSGAIELLRVLGAVGIVIFHVGAPGAQIGYAALPMFIALSLIFTLDQPGPLSRILLTRWQRVGRPFLFWSAIFAAIKTADEIAAGGSALGWVAPWMWMTGPSIHLWFLPFIFVSAILTWLIWPALKRLPPRGLSITCAALSFGLLWAMNAGDWPYGLAQWLFGAPAVLLAMSFATAPRRADPVALAAWGVMIAAAAGFGFTQGTLQLGVTVVVLWCAFRLPFPTPRWLAGLAGLSLGVYLIHPIFGALLVRLVPSAPHGSLTLAGLVIAASAVVTFGILRLPLLRRFV